MAVLLEVAKKESATLDQISDAVNRDKSSAHQCLSKLLSAGLVNKQSKTLKGGWYFHVYSVVEFSKIKQ